MWLRVDPSVHFLSRHIKHYLVVGAVGGEKMNKKRFLLLRETLVFPRRDVRV